MWTEAQLDELSALVAEGLSTGEIARRLCRSYGGVAAAVARGGMQGAKADAPLIPRGQGYDKRSAKRHLVDLWRFSGTPQQYARAVGLDVDPLINAFKKHYPLGWSDYERDRGQVPEEQCGNCGRNFYPNSARQRYCSTRCSQHARADEAYFGGRRQTAMGMSAGVCQVCLRKPKKGLSVHHVFGKENDPEDAVLVALCRGCHRLVSDLAQRTFLDNPRAIENLIMFAWLRRHGAEHDPDDDVIRVEVAVTEPELAAA